MNEQIHTQVKPAQNSSSFSPTRSGFLQRKCAYGGTPGLDGECTECRRRRLLGLQRSLQQGLGSSSEPSEAPTVVYDVLASPGQPLDSAARVFMESRFGNDFSQVRVHSGAIAEQSARDLNANAYTVGCNIVFASGKYAPHTAEGRKLIAHELAHVVQQGTQTSLPASVPLPIDTSGEPAAEQASDKVMSGQAAGHVGSGRATSIQRQILAPRPMPPLPSPGPWGMPKTFPLPPVYPAPGEKPEPEDRRKRVQCGDRQLPYTLVSFFPGPLGQGGRVKASPLTLCAGNTVGSEPQERIYRDQFKCIEAAGERGYWVRGHILHGKTARSGDRNLHGPGDTAANLIIIDQSLNQNMRTWIEDAALKLVYGPLPHVLWLDAWVDSYYPGLPFFAESISVEYGRFNTLTGREGPRLNSRQFVLGRKPPNCPAQWFAEGIFPGRRSRTRSGFQGTLQICKRSLKSRVFDVPNGGVMVAIDAKWVGKAGGEPDRANTQPEGCRSQNYHVSLYQKGRFIDEFIDRYDNLIPGRREVMTWRELDDDEYDLSIWTKAVDPYCCLVGDITVDTFPAPGPKARQKALEYEATHA